MSEREKNRAKYGDIIDRPRPRSRKEPMDRGMRAAQFAPFAALTGYDAAVAEAGRRTENEIETTEEQRAYLDEVLAAVLERGVENVAVQVTYFIPDDRKTGGRYEVASGHIAWADKGRGILVMDDGSEILTDAITEIETEGELW